MSKGLLDLIIDSIFDEKWIGRRGEKLTERELKLVQLFGRKGKVLRNVYFPKDNGETSEVDVIFITQKGIFVFESKNYSGWIFGDEKGKNWTVMLPNRQKNAFYNPIMQNKTHLKWMRNFIGEKIPLFSIIVFSERCELKKVTVRSEDIKVIKRDKVYITVKELWDKNPDIVSDEQIEKLYASLKELTKVDHNVKTAHINNIEKKYKKENNPKDTEIKKTEQKESKSTKCESVEKKSMEREAIKLDETKNKAKIPNTMEPRLETTTEEKMVCPRCGRELVLRVAKKGENAGRQFYGCSGFPKCRYILNC